MSRGFPRIAALAQPVEHLIRNEGVACSSHASGTTQLPENTGHFDRSAAQVEGEMWNGVEPNPTKGNGFPTKNPRLNSTRVLANRGHAPASDASCAACGHQRAIFFSRNDLTRQANWQTLSKPLTALVSLGELAPSRPDAWAYIEL
jgi:hypothetical protein